MEFREALNIVNQAVFISKKQYLTDLQINIFQGSWEGKSYEGIATELKYTYKYISQQAGTQLWNLLSQALGESVSKTNFRAAIERRSQLIYQEISSANSEFVEHQERFNELPLPLSEPELPIGQVPLNSAFYVERPPIEERCYQEILQPGALIRIKAPKLMGKTSLMARIMHYARERGYQIVPLSFDLADNTVFTNLDTFLRWFCENVGRKLKRLEQLNDYWTIYGSKDKTTAYFEECLLEEITSPLVIALDEVHRIFSHRNIADDFFSLLRAWYEYARYGDYNSEVWQKLRIILVHSKEVYIPLDINQSPFNIGLSIELQEFNRQQVGNFLIYHKKLNWTTTQVEKLMEMVGGHPYLIRQALYYIQHQDITLEELLQTAPEEAGIYRDHLRRQLGNLKQDLDLAAAFKQVVTTPEAVELNSDLVFKLDSMGLVVHRPENKVTWRCELYRQYFSSRLS